MLMMQLQTLFTVAVDFLAGSDIKNKGPKNPGLQTKEHIKNLEVQAKNIEMQTKKGT